MISHLIGLRGLLQQKLLFKLSIDETVYRLGDYKNYNTQKFCHISLNINCQKERTFYW